TRPALLPAQGLAVPGPRAHGKGTRDAAARRPRLRWRGAPGGSRRQAPPAPGRRGHGRGGVIEHAPGFTGLVDLAAGALGGRAIGTSDDFFAPMTNLVAPGR